MRAKGRHQGHFVALSGLRKIPGPPGSRYPVMIVDGDGLPVFHLSEWYRCAKTSDQGRTPDTYLAMLLPFAGFQLRHHYAWNAPPEQVCAHLVEFFREDVACQVSPSTKSDGYQVETTGHSPLSTSSLGVLLAALTSLYDVLKAAGYYPYTNPLRSESLLALKHAHLRSVQNAGAPDHAGIRSESKAESRTWPTSTFYQKRRKTWEPDVVMEPEEIQQRIRDAIDYMITQAPSLRDKVVLLLLRTTGARLSEILHLTAGGYRKESNVERALVTNKGSRGREEKTIYFTATITTALHKYIRTERAHHDPSGRKQLEDLEDTDPIFLTERGTPYDRDAFYYHWNKLFKSAQVYDKNKHKSENTTIFRPIEFTPHDLRHLHVTRNLTKIEAKAKDNASLERELKDGFRQIMDWKSEDTMQVYTHVRNKRKALLEVMLAEEEEQNTQGRSTLALHHQMTQFDQVNQHLSSGQGQQDRADGDVKRHMKQSHVKDDTNWYEE